MLDPVGLLPSCLSNLLTPRTETGGGGEHLKPTVLTLPHFSIELRGNS